MPSLETLDEFKKSHRLPAIHRDIYERWDSRIKPAELAEKGAAGAEAYLERYAKTAGTQKLIGFAMVADARGFHEFANTFWLKAYILENGHPPIMMTSAQGDNVIVTPAEIEDMEAVKAHDASATPAIVLSDLPALLQPGILAPMQPVDAKRPRTFYVASDKYWGQPKRDGDKMLVFVSRYGIHTQSRQLKVNPAPSEEFEESMEYLMKYMGTSFILEGELYYLAVDGKEFMSAATCQVHNESLGKADILPVMKYAIFSCLFAGRSFETQAERVDKGAAMARLLSKHSSIFEVLDTAKTKDEKILLCQTQHAEGREGEVFFHHDMQYHAGKINDDKYVRCKYHLGMMDLIISSVAPTTADGHLIGGFAVMDDMGKQLGSVGTGYDREEQKEILMRHQANPGKAHVLVSAQSFTEYGQLRHAVFQGFPDKPKDRSK
jgi:bifunctional non-homologous end joining protein LigD